jgi:hypothetical protein
MYTTYPRSAMLSWRVGHAFPEQYAVDAELAQPSAQSTLHCGQAPDNLVPLLVSGKQALYYFSASRIVLNFCWRTMSKGNW